MANNVCHASPIVIVIDLFNEPVLFNQRGERSPLSWLNEIVELISVTV